MDVYDWLKTHYKKEADKRDKIFSLYQDGQAKFETYLKADQRVTMVLDLISDSVGVDFSGSAF